MFPKTEDREATGIGDEMTASSSSSNPSATATTNITTTIRTAPKKRFLQLYTSKAYDDQWSKLVQPREENSSVDDDGDATVCSLDENADNHADCSVSNREWHSIDITLSEPANI